jgi:Cu(I)/Ag(I) efflux system periplasmic protein CusF
MKALLYPIVVAAALMPFAAWSQSPPPPPAPTQASAATSIWTDGEVRKVDKSAGKVTLKHGDIKNLDMPAMTMVFIAKDAKLIDKLKVGDKVRFQAISEGEKLVVTQIQPAK